MLERDNSLLNFLPNLPIDLNESGETVVVGELEISDEEMKCLGLQDKRR